MALTDLLYRCPFCGHDPLVGKGLRARCPGCGRSYAPGRGGTAIRVTTKAGQGEEVPAGELSSRLEAIGGAVGPARTEAGRLELRSPVRARFAGSEVPVRFRGELLGFYEEFGEPVPGELSLEHDRLVFRPDEGGDGAVRWPLLELAALQTSSSSVQISPRSGGVVLFRFEDASVRRWEELLRAAISEAWRGAGRGEVVEFQPRIRTG